VAPGVIGLRVWSRNRAEKRSEARRDAKCREVAAQLHAAAERDLTSPWEVLGLVSAGFVEGDDDDVPTRGLITRWSAKSRAQFVRAMGEIDFRPIFAAPAGQETTLTLTYPRDWLTAAPSAAVSKRHIDALDKRWQQAWGQGPSCVWKREFQERGAPHYHWLTVVPVGRCRKTGETFRVWLSRNWNEVVREETEARAPGVISAQGWADHRAAGTSVDPEDTAGMRTPRRVALYFLKHGSPGQAGSKAYQNEVPRAWREAAERDGTGVGRFWGYRRLQRVRVSTDVPAQQTISLRRFLRRYSASQARWRSETVTRVDTRTGMIRRRRVHRRWHAFAGGQVVGGWTSTDNGPALAAAIGRFLENETGARPQVGTGAGTSGLRSEQDAGLAFELGEALVADLTPPPVGQGLRCCQDHQPP
jgi:hypothetical protein